MNVYTGMRLYTGAVGVQTLKFPHTDLVKQLQRKQPVDIKISNYILYTLAML